MREARSFIVRIYGRKAKGELKGTIEIVSSGERVGFSSAAELWAVVSYDHARPASSKRPPVK